MKPLAAMLLLSSALAVAQPPCLEERSNPGVWQLQLDQHSRIEEEGNGRGAALRSDGIDKASACTGARGASSRAWVAKPRIEYEGGDASERRAEVRDEEIVEDRGGQFVRFAIGAANVRNRSGMAIKARMQVNLYGNRKLNRYAQEIDVRLGPGFAILLDQPPAIDWLTLGEWWNDAPWVNRTRGFRVSLNLHKPAGAAEGAWRLVAHAQSMDPATGKWLSPYWRASSPAVLKVGRWNRLQISLVEGDEESGRFALALVEGEARTPLIDVRGRTRHDDSGDDGWVHVNPIKLYTSKPNLDSVRRQGAELSLDWRRLRVINCDIAKDEAACQLTAR
ncbi:MAG: hypothetical protein EOP38_03590 [Rubrivivax sp.]|nr:MAG: hypothetical protein EOP38_03590 [Rubrivivax sp.]